MVLSFTVRSSADDDAVTLLFVEAYYAQRMALSDTPADHQDNTNLTK